MQTKKIKYGFVRQINESAGALCESANPPAKASSMILFNFFLLSLQFRAYARTETLYTWHTPSSWANSRGKVFQPFWSDFQACNAKLQLKYLLRVFFQFSEAVFNRNRKKIVCAIAHLVYGRFARAPPLPKLQALPTLQDFPCELSTDHQSQYCKYTKQN